jgi:hypothetical protein
LRDKPERVRLLYNEAAEQRNHIQFHEYYIRHLAEQADVAVCCQTGYYGTLPEGVSSLGEKPAEGGQVLLQGKLGLYRFFRALERVADGFGAHAILQLWYYPIIFPIFCLLNPSRRPRFVEMVMTTEVLQGRFRSLLFRLVKDRVYFVVVSSYNKDTLVKTYGVRPDRVFVLPLSSKMFDAPSFPDGTRYVFTAMSRGTNSEAHLRAVIDHEKEHETILRSGIKVFFRSREQSFDNGGLTVRCDYLDQGEYRRILCESEVSVALQDLGFSAVSGVVIEAFSNHKVVVGLPIQCVQYYAKKYPAICKVLPDIDAVMSFVAEYGREGLWSTTEEREADWRRFEQEHSDDAMRRAVSEMLSVIVPDA